MVGQTNYIIHLQCNLSSLSVLCFGFKWGYIQTLTFCSFKFSFDCRRTYPVVNHSAEGLAIKLVTHTSSVYDLKSEQTRPRTSFRYAYANLADISLKIKLPRKLFNGRLNLIKHGRVLISLLLEKIMKYCWGLIEK